MAEKKAVRASLALIGGGGHCRACIDVIAATGEWDIRGVLDLPERAGDSVLGYSVIGTDERISSLAAEGVWFLVCIGQIKTPQPRRRAYDVVKAAGGRLATIVSPLAYVSPAATIGEGSIVMHRALINAGARVCNNVIVNTMALIEHDTVVGDHCHVATGAVANGGVTIGAGSFVGSNAVIVQGSVVSENAFVPAATLYRPFVS